MEIENSGCLIAMREARSVLEQFCVAMAEESYCNMDFQQDIVEIVNRKLDNTEWQDEIA